MARKLGLTATVVLSLNLVLLGQTFPTGFNTTTLVPSGLTDGTCFVLTPDGRAFITRQTGQIRVWKPGTGLLATPFHTFTVDSFFERGLIGLALDPDFAANGYLYAHYTATTPTTHGRIVRITASALDPDVADADSVVALLDMNTLSAGNHNGGAIHFGPDGKLYIGVGENAVSSNSQSIANLLGKMLRINTTPGDVIPTDNPASFPGITGSPAGNNRAIWAVGLRNPFTFAFEPGTGRMFIDDVGGGQFEEINDGVAGRNYGWSRTEGDFDPDAFPDFTRPVHAYGRSTGQCITGGTFYRPQISPYPADYYGKYFFSDISSRWIKRLDPANAAVANFGSSVGSVVDARVNADGKLVYLVRGSPALLVVNYNSPLPPTITSQPVDRSVCPGAAAAFSVSVSASPAGLSFQWRRDGSDLVDGDNIAGAATPNLTIADATEADLGAYDCVVRNNDGDAASDAADLAILTDVSLDGGHIQRFVEAVIQASPEPPLACLYDFNIDGLLDFNDVSGFVLALLND